MNEEPPISQEIADDLNEAFEDGDIERACLAIGTAVKTCDVAELARKSGLSRPSLYRAFAGNGAYPNLTTIVKVLDAMGFQLKVVSRSNSAKGF